MPWTRLTRTFAQTRPLAARFVVCAGLIFVMIGCRRSERAPATAGAASGVPSENAEPPAYSPETFRAEVERLVTSGNFDGAARLLESTDVERQLEHDAAGYLAVAEYMIMLPGVRDEVEFDRQRDWIFPGTSDVIENAAWQKAATEFATRYNTRRASEPGRVEQAAAADDDWEVNLAFVLLSKAQAPEADAVAQAFRAFAAPDETIQVQADGAADDPLDRGLSLELNTGEKSVVALIPGTVPGDEAEQGAQFSVASLAKDWQVPPYSAYLIVTFTASGKIPPVERVTRFTSILAAVTKASPAVAVYWGKAGATHESKFFTAAAADPDLRMLIWSGLSVARDEDGRLSLLSTGMEQFELPNLLLLAGESSEGEALAFMYDLLGYVARRGEALPEGDTVGWTDDQRLPVRYVESPVDPHKRVFCIELP